jgi:hypothetical protein
MLKATVILTTYHGLCGLCMGMGLQPDEDIRDEMSNLIGVEALQLCVIPKVKNKVSFYHTSDTGGDADESSMASKSINSGQIDEQTEKIYNKLMKTE